MGDMEQSCIFGRATEERGDEDEGGLRLRPRSSGLIFRSRHPENVNTRNAFGKNVDQQEQINPWSASSLERLFFQRGDVLTSKTGIFGSQAGSDGLTGFSINPRSRSCSMCSTNSTSSTNSCSS